MQLQFQIVDQTTSQQIVKIRLPMSSLPNIKNLIPPQVSQKIKDQNLDVDEIFKDIENKGVGLVFEFAYEGRKLLISLIEN